MSHLTHSATQTAKPEAIRNNLEHHPVILAHWWLSHLAYNHDALTQIQKIYYLSTFEHLQQPFNPYYIFALDPKCVDNHEDHIDPGHPYDRAKLESVLKAFEMWYQVFNHTHGSARVGAYFYTQYPLSSVKDCALNHLKRATATTGPS